MHSYDDILDRIRSTLAELFEIDRAAILPAARLYEDLGMDSIEVVDLMDEVQTQAGRKAISARCAPWAIGSPSCSA
jgi:acyl carrier protein